MRRSNDDDYIGGMDGEIPQGDVREQVILAPAKVAKPFPTWAMVAIGIAGFMLLLNQKTGRG